MFVVYSKFTNNEIDHLEISAKKIEIDKSYPGYIVNNIEKFSEWII